MKAKILVVEDNSAIAETMRTLLELEGYRVTTAADGKEGIAALAAEKPNLILLDMMMPGMNGWHFLDYQRENAEYSNIPVVVVSAFGEIAKSVQPAAYLSKPLELNTLLATVEKYARQTA